MRAEKELLAKKVKFLKEEIRTFDIQAGTLGDAAAAQLKHKLDTVRCFPRFPVVPSM